MNGIVLPGIVGLEDPALLSGEEDKYTISVPNNGLLLHNNVFLDWTAFQGEILPGIWSLVFENNVFLDPYNIDAGLIGTEQQYTISLWNAGKAVLELNSIEFSNLGGYILEGPLTAKIYAESIVQWTLRILLVGPTTQNTVISFICDSATFTVTVTGRRIETFAFPCNAINQVKIKYQFETIVARSFRFAEQRRALRMTPRRTMAVEYTIFDQTKREQFINFLCNFQNKIIAVPFYPEEFEVSTDPVGSTSIILGTQIDYRYTLEKSKYLVIYNEEDPLLSEVLVIASIAAGVITVTTPVTKSYVGKSFVAPAFLSVCPKIDGVIQNMQVADFTVEYEEYDA